MGAAMHAKSVAVLSRNPLLACRLLRRAVPCRQNNCNRKIQLCGSAGQLLQLTGTHEPLTENLIAQYNFIDTSSGQFSKYPCYYCLAIWYHEHAHFIDCKDILTL